MFIERTANFMRLEDKNGSKRIRRIPWDLLAIDGQEGLFLSPMPVAPDFDHRGTTTAYTADIIDMIADDISDKTLIDEVTDIQWWDSEEEFNAKMGLGIGFYKSDAGTEFPVSESSLMSLE